MSKKKLLITFSTMFLLSGCATVHHEAIKHDQDYLKQSQTVPATKVPAASAPSMQSYYPIPPVNANYNAQPSTIPPGSQLAPAAQPQLQQRVNAAAPMQPAKNSIVMASSNTALALNVPYDQAWARVGQGLKASGYKVMQQDKGMGAYYILDLAGTGGVLKTNTPIYRINVKAVGATTNISLVDGQNNAVSPAISNRILGALKQKL